MKIKDIALRERPREKMVLEGVDKLSNRDILALLLKTGSGDKSALDLADEILSLDYKGITFLKEVGLKELMSIDGIGEAKASVILAAVELGVRISKNQVLNKGQITSVEDIVELYMEELRYEKKEYFNAVFLDTKGKILACENVSSGDLNSSIVHPRETFKKGIVKSANSIILVHNHPSGNPEPSKDDCMITKRLQKAGEIIGIEVIDHVIIGNGCYVSMKELGFI